jgi:hypothetical protein
MAYCLWAMGCSKPERLKAFKSDPKYEIAGKWKVRRNQIHTYFSDDFWHNLSLYQTFKTCGLPYNVGWAQHPKDIINLIRIFEQAEVLYQNSQVKDGNS